MAVFPLGNLISDIVTDVKAWFINGTSAHGDPATGNPLQSGGVYRVEMIGLNYDDGSQKIYKLGNVIFNNLNMNIPDGDLVTDKITGTGVWL